MNAYWLKLKAGYLAILEALRGYWRVLRTKLKGFKTLFFSLFLFVAGLADWLQWIDLHSLLAIFIKDENLLGKVVAAVAFLFGALRFATNTGIFKTEDAE